MSPVGVVLGSSSRPRSRAATSAAGRSRKGESRGRVYFTQHGSIDNNTATLVVKTRETKHETSDLEASTEARCSALRNCKEQGHPQGPVPSDEFPSSSDFGYSRCTHH